MPSSNRQVIRILFSLVCYAITGITFRLLAPLYLEHLGAGPLATGVVLAAHSLLPVVLSVWGSALAAGLSLQRIFTIGSGILVLASVSLACSGNLVVIFFALAASGVMWMMAIITIQSHIYRVSSARDRTRNFSWLLATVACASIIGPTTGGLLICSLGYQGTYLTVALMALLATIMSWRLSRERLEQVAPARVTWGQIRTLMASAHFRLSLMLTVVSISLLSLSLSFYPLYLRHLDYGPELVGMMLSLRGVGELGGSILLSFLASRMRQDQLLCFSLGLTLLIVSVTPLASGLLSLVSISILFGACFGLLIPVSLVLATEGTTAQTRPVALGLRFTVNRSMDTIGPPVFGAVTHIWGYGAPFITTAFGFASALLYTFSRRDVLVPVTPAERSEAAPCTDG